MKTKAKAAFIIDTIFILFLAVLIYIFLKYIVFYIMPFIVSFLLVYILQKPMINLSNKLKIKKSIITVISLVLIISMLIFLIYFIGDKLLSFTLSFINNAENITHLTNQVITYFTPFNSALSSFLPEDINIFDNFLNSMGDLITNFAKIIIGLVPSFIIGFVVSIVSAFFFSIYYDDMLFFIKKQLTERSIKIVVKLKEVINYSVFNLFKGYLILFFITFLEMFIGFTVLGLKNKLAIAIIVAMIDAFPVFGTGTILIPWGIYQIINDDLILGIGILILYVVSFVLRYFLEPKIIGKNMGINPLVSLISIFVGLKLFGIIGILTFPLIVSIIVVLNNKGLIKLWK